MCHSSCGCGKGGCGVMMVAKVLVLVGAINWGLVGLGALLNSGNMDALNVVHLILGPWSTLEAVVYLLVGVAGLMKIFGCRCSKCKAACAACAADGGKMGGSM